MSMQFVGEIKQDRRSDAFHDSHPTLPKNDAGSVRPTRATRQMRAARVSAARSWAVKWSVALGIVGGLWIGGALAQENEAGNGGETNSTQTDQPPQTEGESATQPAAQEPAKEATNQKPFQYKIDKDYEGLRRLTPDNEVWFDVKQKIVVADSEVVLNRGPLEMFACPPGTKEHESVLRVKSAAFVIHAGLLAVGAKSGHPVEFIPEYKSATGTIVDIYVVWEADGKQRWATAQDWVINSKTRKKMETHWVFAGSGYWTNPNTNTRHYLAESGELICVSNFTTATMDLPVESSQANEGLLFEANTDNIPPRGTPVKLVLAPRVKDEAKTGEDKDKESTATDDNSADKTDSAIEPPAKQDGGGC